MGTFNYIEETGLVIPDTSEILQDVQEIYRSIFGEDFIVDPRTPEGALINSEVLTRISIARNNASLANQINPNLADGPFLDAIWALTGGSRIAESRSTVTANVTGTPGLFLPAGAEATTTDGAVFRSTFGLNLDTSGQGSVTFESVVLCT